MMPVVQYVAVLKAKSNVTATNVTKTQSVKWWMEYETVSVIQDLLEMDWIVYQVK